MNNEHPTADALRWAGFGPEDNQEEMLDGEVATRDWPTPEARPDLLPKPESESVLTRLCRAIGWGRQGL